MRRPLLLIAGCALAGCSTTPFTDADLASAPPPAGYAAGGYASPAVAAPAASASSTAAESPTGAANRLMAQGSVDQAAQVLEEALKVNPFDPVALNNLAVAKVENQQYNEALSLLERAAHLAPDNTEIVANLARLRTWVRNYALIGALPPASSQAGTPTGATSLAGNGLPPPPPALWSSSTPP